MVGQTSVELDVQVFMLQQVPKRDSSDVNFFYGMPAPTDRRDRRDYDPNLVAVQLRHPQDNNQDFVFNMLISKTQAERLGLMMGDKLKLTISKTS